MFCHFPQNKLFANKFLMKKKQFFLRRDRLKKEKNNKQPGSRIKIEYKKTNNIKNYVYSFFDKDEK